MKLTENFSLEELACHDGTPVPEAFVPNAIRVAVGIAQPLRDRYEDLLHVWSGYRTRAHNLAVNGAPHSDHLTCSAFDLGPDPVKFPDGSRALQSQVELLVLYLRDLISENLVPELGYVEICNRWVHVSARPRISGKVIWNDIRTQNA